MRIELHPYDVKAFFELPIKERNINLNNLVKLSCMDKQKYSEEARKIHSKVKDLKTHLETGRLVYNIIKYNTPLALFHDQISDRLKKLEIKNFPQRLREVIDSHEKDKREIYKNSETIRISRNYIIDKDFYINLHFHLALLNSAYKFWKQKIDGKEPELKHIQHTFTEVYRKLRLGANSRFLERDCDEISSSVNNYLGDLTQAKLLEEIRWPDKNQTAKPSESILSDRKRNFFAHSGFLRDITKVKKRDNDILLEYDSGPFKREVMPWIENPDR